MSAEVYPIADDIPTDKAWKVGRRIYVRAGYRSSLDAAVRDLGGKWDSAEKALWVGSGKVDQVVEAVRAQAERAADVRAVKEAGHWAKLSGAPDYAKVRALAKSLGGVWDRDKLQWALPTAEAADQVLAAAKARKAEILAPVRARQEADDAAEVERIVGESGRTLTGERYASRVYLGPMRRPEAEGKFYPGQVVRAETGDGRILVVARRLSWVSELDADDFGQPGRYGFFADVVVVPVERNDEERRRDEDRAAATQDAADIEDLVDAVRAFVKTAATVDTLTPGHQVLIEGRQSQLVTGQITLGQDGRWWWQQPGTYDDSRKSEAEITDAALIARLYTVLIDRGARKLDLPGRRHYAVTRPAEDDDANPPPVVGGPPTLD